MKTKIALEIRLRMRWLLIGVGLVFLLPSSRMMAAEGPPADLGIVTEENANWLPTLTRISHVRDLTPEEASKNFPVWIEGVVTFALPDTSLVFVQDYTAGISVRVNSQHPDAKAGARVEIRGTSDLEDYAPSVRASSLEVLGEGELPEPGGVGLTELMTGRYDGFWMETKGVVRSLTFENDIVELEVFGDGGNFHVWVPSLEDAPENLQNSVVRIRGVVESLFNDRRRVAGLRLWTPSFDFIEFVEVTEGDPFSLATRTISDLLQSSGSEALRRLNKVEGVVTAHWPGRFLFIQDQTDGIQVLSTQTAPLKPGDLVEVVGYSAPGAGGLIFNDAEYRYLSDSQVPEAIEVLSGAAVDPDYDSKRVELEATVINSLRRGNEYVWTLQTGGWVFEAICESLHVDLQDIEGLPAGAVVKLTGVYSLIADEYKNPLSFKIFLESPEAIEVVTLPEWWNPERTFQAAVWASAFGVLALIWIRLLRSKIKQQTAQIQERLERESALERNFKDLFENANDPILTMDLRGNITAFNRAAVEITGYSKTEAQSLNFFDLMSPEDRIHCRAVFESGFENGDESVYDVNVIRKDGSVVHLEMSPQLIREKGQVAGVQCIGRDVSKRKEAERQVEQARDAAEEASRAKSEFLATMSHEIRTPMNGIIGMTNILLDSPLDTDQKDCANIVKSSADSLLHIINEILDFSKIEAGKMNFENIDFDLEETIDGALELLVPRAAEKHLELGVLISHDVSPLLKGDPGRLRQVIINLMNNAIKFTEKGDVMLRVGLENENDSKVILKFEVSDTGIGIPEKARLHLFNPFTQVDSSTTRNYGGTGLGLAICKQITNLMGGEIGVESNPGEGSTFWFTASFETQELLGQPEEEALDLSGHRVLIVDDNENSREILQHHLKEWKADCESSTGAMDGLALLRRSAAAGRAIDLAIVDIDMPNMDGVTFARAVNEDPNVCETKIILLNSLSQQLNSNLKLSALGCSRVIAKPVKKSDLHKALRDIYKPVAKPVKTFDMIPGPENASEPNGSANELKVLIAEDNLINQKVSLLQLRKLGYKADIVVNGHEVIEALERKRYDLILMDCQMPEMDGFEATRTIRKNPEWKEIRIVAVTANALSGDREKCIEAGMDDYLSKPVKSNELEAVLLRSSLVVSQGAKEENQTPDRINYEILNELNELSIPGKLDAVRECIEFFIEHAPEKIRKIQESFEARQEIPIRDAAHALKGSSANIGADRLAAICQSIETLAENNNLDEMGKLVYEMSVEFQETVRLLHERNRQTGK